MKIDQIQDLDDLNLVIPFLLNEGCNLTITKELNQLKVIVKDRNTGNFEMVTEHCNHPVSEIDGIPDMVVTAYKELKEHRNG